jgi:Domain of unknown function (DU1801)
MAENKTKPTDVDPADFIAAVENEQRRKDATELAKLMRKATGEKPEMWGPTIVGFGRVHYRYESGREGDVPLTGFSPRKANLVLYLGSSLDDEKLMAGLGKHKRGKGCLYVNKLDDIDRDVLRALVEKTVDKREHGHD